MVRCRPFPSSTFLATCNSLDQRPCQSVAGRIRGGSNGCRSAPTAAEPRGLAQLGQPPPRSCCWRRVSRPPCPPASGPSVGVHSRARRPSPPWRPRPSAALTKAVAAGDHMGRRDDAAFPPPPHSVCRRVGRLSGGGRARLACGHSAGRGGCCRRREGGGACGWPARRGSGLGGRRATPRPLAPGGPRWQRPRP